MSMRWTGDEIARCLADHERVAARSVLTYGNDRDAGELLNRHLRVDGPDYPADEPAWWADHALHEVVVKRPGGWHNVDDPLPDGDLSVLTRALDYDHWDVTRSGAYARFLRGGQAVLEPWFTVRNYRRPMSNGMPMLITTPFLNPLFILVRLRLLRGLQRQDILPALREVRHLARLTYSIETLYSTICARSILGLERRAWEVAVERGLPGATEWEPASSEELQAMRRSGFSMAMVVSGLAGCTAAERLLASPGPLHGLCGGIDEATWFLAFQAHFLGERSLQGGRWGSRATLEAFLARTDGRCSLVRPLLASKGLSGAVMESQSLARLPPKDRLLYRLYRLPLLRRAQTPRLLAHITQHHNQYRREAVGQA